MQSLAAFLEKYTTTVLPAKIKCMHLYIMRLNIYCRVAPLVEVAMLENCLAHTEIDWTCEAPCNIDLKYTLQAPSSSASTAEHPLCCTSVSWSSTGKYLNCPM